jgi:hypothetical protein
MCPQDRLRECQDDEALEARLEYGAQLKLGGVLLISLGIAGIVFRTRITETNVAWSEAWLGRELRKKARRATSLLTLLIALLFVVLGSVALVSG